MIFIKDLCDLVAIPAHSPFEPSCRRDGCRQQGEPRRARGGRQDDKQVWHPRNRRIEAVMKGGIRNPLWFDAADRDQKAWGGTGKTSPILRTHRAHSSCRVPKASCYTSAGSVKPVASNKKGKRVLAAKSAARERFESACDGLIDLSHRIHAYPELGFEEDQASSWLCESLSDAGFKAEKGICDLPTAFLARAGSGPLHIAICAEYDCLPEIGHACGHNIIAASAVGAALAAAKVADELGLTISVIGTPAEEVGNASGKILLLERGAFEGIHAAMMVHPAPFDMLRSKMIAASMFEVHCTGKESHASAFPEEGVNAADALTIAQTALGLLRQHIRSTDRIHGIVTNGGAAPNVVPAHTSAKYIIRSETLDQLIELRPRVYRCFEAGGLATGAKIEISGGDKPYAEMRHDEAMARLYRMNSESLGRKFPNLGEWETRPTGSTDMGNVSLAMPSIHPSIGINSLPAVNHQPEFAAHCVTPDADKALRDGALAMAWTCIDLAMELDVRQGLMARR